MAAYIIKVSREMTDMAVRKNAAAHSHFYNDTDDMCVGHWKPNTDIYETDEHVIIRLELANVSRNDISVVVKNGKLQITGIRRALQGTDPIYFHQMEIHCGEFSKIITVPDSLEHNEISAALEDGILTIYISKVGDVVEIPIMINSESEPNR